MGKQYLSVDESKIQIQPNSLDAEESVLDVY